MAKTRKTKRTPKYITKPTLVAVGKDGKGRLKLLVGSRRITAFKGQLLAKGRRYWSQLKHLHIGKSKAGKVVLVSRRAAKAAGLELVS